ncbi:MAG: hypothetical protein ACLTDX_02210 [[Clostridium] innocuum]
MKQLTFTIFGGTGDLTFRKLLPALYNLQAQSKAGRGFLHRDRRTQRLRSMQAIVRRWQAGSKQFVSLSSIPALNDSGIAGCQADSLCTDGFYRA